MKSLVNKRALAIKASDNLIKAIEQGIITEQTKIRLKELETEISQLDFDIEQEKQRSYTYLTQDMIEKYLNSVICGDLDDIEIRKSIIKTFVREIVLTNDKITIAFNFIDHSSTKGRLKDDMQEIEKQAQKPAFTIPLSSYKLASLPPNSTETNT